MQIILNADDFGGSTGINAAVIQAHRQGILTSASLMVAGDAADEAVALARETPTLAVGLHLVVIAGRPTSPPEQIPHLLDGTGHFPEDPFVAGLRYFFSYAARQEIAREVEAQFERFAATGLPLSHVDGHLHMHLHPTVFSLLLPLAARYGAQGLRLPRDDFWLALRYDRRRPVTKAAQAIVFGLLCRHHLKQMGNHHPAVAHRVYGLMQTGQMEEAYVLELLRRPTKHHPLPPTAELYFHPSIVDEGEVLGANPGDLATLLSSAVRNVIHEQSLRLATYATLDKE